MIHGTMKIPTEIIIDHSLFQEECWHRLQNLIEVQYDSSNLEHQVWALAFFLCYRRQIQDGNWHGIKCVYIPNSGVAFSCFPKNSTFHDTCAAIVIVLTASDNCNLGNPFILAGEINNYSRRSFSLRALSLSLRTKVGNTSCNIICIQCLKFHFPNHLTP